MTIDPVLILGATGKTGRRLIPRLRLRDVRLRVASRSSETRFDWDDSSTWAVALDGVKTVYLVPPDTVGPVRPFVAQAEEAGVERLILLSGHRADTWGASSFGLDMRAAEDAVRGSSLEWTVLRASNFNQNFDENVFHPALMAGELALPAGPVPEPFIDLEDVADATVTALTEPGEHAGKVYELTGPQSWTFPDAVNLIARVSGRPMRYRQISVDEYTSALISQGLSEQEAHPHAEMFTVMEHGELAKTSADITQLLGRDRRTFEDYVVRATAAGAWK